MLTLSRVVLVETETTEKILYETEYRNSLFIFCFDKQSVFGKHTFCQNRLCICLEILCDFGEKVCFYSVLSKKTNFARSIFKFKNELAKNMNCQEKVLKKYFEMSVSKTWKSHRGRYV